MRVVVELLLVASQNVIRVEKATTPRLFRLEATKSQDTNKYTHPAYPDRDVLQRDKYYRYFLDR